MNKFVGFVPSLQVLAGLIKRAGRTILGADTGDALFTERERAQVTLDAIGDAVISSDFRGRVVYLNKAAENMTGYSQKSAQNLPIAEVLRLVDATSRSSLSDPAVEAIIENEKRFASENCLIVRRDGNSVPVGVSSTPIHDRLGGVVGAVTVARDMTAARELSEKLSRLALYDQLTGLPNRALFADRVDRAITSAGRTAKPFSLLYIDLDNFKCVNDTLGHDAGDQVLQSAGERLRQCVRESDTVSRHGGDEFLALLIDCAHSDDGIPCASKIIETLREPYNINGRNVCLSGSVGIAVFPSDATDLLALIRAADIAMYSAKCAGRNGFQRFHGSSHRMRQAEENIEATPVVEARRDRAVTGCVTRIGRKAQGLA